jgi:hypothetical protein
VLLSCKAYGPRLDPAAVEQAWQVARASKSCGFDQLRRFVAAARLPET